MRNIEWKEGYVADQSNMTDKHGKLYKKNDPSRKRQARFDERDIIDNMQREYAKNSPITRAWCGKGDFDKVLAEAKKPKKKRNPKAMKLAQELLSR